MPAQGLATFTILRSRQDCGLRNCVIVRQTVSPNTFRKANANITVMYLSSYCISRMSDGDACNVFFRCARHSVSAHSQETFCHLSRNSVSMLFCQTHWCCSVWVAWLSRRRVRYVVHACARVEPCGRTPPTFGQLQQTRMQNYPFRVRRKSSTLAGQDTASGTEPSEQGLTSSIGERCPHPQIHFRSGSRRRP